MSSRFINLGGGNYNANIEGDYIQGDRKQKKEEQPQTIDVEVIEEEVINTNGANYTENIRGNIIKGDVVE